MRRHQATYGDFLQLLLDLPGLPDWERARIQQVLEGSDPDGLESLAHDLIESLTERGILRDLPADSRGGRHLEDPWNHRIFHLPDARRPLVRRLHPEPVDPGDLFGPDQQPENALGADLSTLLDPRELVGRLEIHMARRLGVARCLFHPVRVPGEWTEILREARPAALLPEIVEEVAGLQGEMLYAPDLSRFPATGERGLPRGSLLVVGVGSREFSWRGAIECHAPEPEGFSAPRRNLAAALAHLLEVRLTASFRLQALVFRDVVTGVYNRSYFEDQMEKEIQIARRKGESLGLCLIDIDDFKSFNTRFGYAGGDRVLREVAHRLRASLRGSDTLARFGGDEFAALLAPPFSPHEGPLIAARFWEAIAGVRFQMETLDRGTAETSVTVSLGGAIYPRDGGTSGELLRSANRNLLSAKEGGKNRWIFPESQPAAGP